MPAPAELINLPQVLNETLVKGRADYERAVRAIRWGELPVWAIGSAQSLPAAETFQYAFQDLQSWPVVVHEAAAFVEGAAAMLRPGSVVVVFADDDQSTQDAVRSARKRGAQVLVLEAGFPTSSKVSAVEEPTLVAGPPLAEAAASAGLGAACLQHAAAAQLALVCARQLARPHPRLERCEREWHDVPAQVGGLTLRLDDGVAALARELKSFDVVLLLGGGYYGAIARRASALARKQAGRPVIGLDLAAFESSWLEALGTECSALALSASTGRSAKVTVATAGTIKNRGCALFAITGSNHHDLIRQARLSLILPETGELPGSILALAVAGWVGAALAG